LSKKKPVIPQSLPPQHDISNAVFSPSNQFETDEIVIIPRTRGGFNFASIQEKLLKENCFYNPKLTHFSELYRVTYHNSDKQVLKKEIPVSYIGKIKSSNFRIASKTELNLDFRSSSKKKDEEEDDDDENRELGNKCSTHDLNILTFNPLSTFKKMKLLHYQEVMEVSLTVVCWKKQLKNVFYQRLLHMICQHGKFSLMKKIRPKKLLVETLAK